MPILVVLSHIFPSCTPPPPSTREVIPMQLVCFFPWILGAQQHESRGERVSSNEHRLSFYCLRPSIPPCPPTKQQQNRSLRARVIEPSWLLAQSLSISAHCCCTCRCMQRWGREKIHPGRRNFNPVGGAGTSVAVEQTPKVEKVPGWVGCFGDRCYGRETSCSWRKVNRPRVIAALEVLVDGS